MTTSVLTLETARLRLRPLEMRDLDAMFAVLGDPRVMRHIGDGKGRTREAVANYLERSARGFARHGRGGFAVERKDTGEVIGDCVVAFIGRSGTNWKDPDQLGPETEVGYRLAASHWGQGFATEAARAAVGWAFCDEGLGLDEIIGVTHPDNEASQRVLLKAGLEARGPSSRFYDTTTALFSTSRERWRERAFQEVASRD
jgi:RimJ/RimL family protein N-acetyltransferase